MKPKKTTVIDKCLQDIPDSSSSDSDSSSSKSSDSDSSQRAREEMINEPPIPHPSKNIDLNEPPISHSNQNVDPIITSAAQLDPTKPSAAQLHNKDADASNNSGINASSENDDSAMKPNVKDKNSNTRTSESNDVSLGTNGGNKTTNEKSGNVSDNNNNNALPYHIELFNFPKHVMDSINKKYNAPNHADAEKEETSDKNTTELVGKDEGMSFEIFDADGESAPFSMEVIDADGRRETSVKVYGNDSTIKRKRNSSNDNEYKAPNHADANTKQSLVHKKEQSTILRLKQVLNATEGK